MIELNIGDKNAESALLMIRSLIENKKCNKISIFEPGEQIESQPIPKSIHGILKELGIPAHLCGYKYISDAVESISGNPRKLKNIVKEVYMDVAKKNNTTYTRVERGIRHAIEVCFERGDVDLIEKMFKFSYRAEKGRPTNKEFLSVLCEKLEEGNYIETGN